MPTTTSKLPPRLILILSGLFLLALVLHFAGVALLRYMVERELHPALPRGTYIGETHLNLLSGLLEIEDFHLRNEDQLRMRFGRLRLDISPWRLLGGEIHVEEVTLAGGYLRVDRLADGSFDLGLPPFGQAPAAAGDTAPPPFSLAGARLERVTVDYHDGDLASVLYVENITLGAFSARLDTQQVPLEWALRWDGRPIAGEAQITIDHGTIAAAGALQTGLLDVEHAQRLARLAPAVVGEVGYQGEFSWQPPQLTVSGALDSPLLSYQADGTTAALDSLKVAAFRLDLLTLPTLGAELALAQPLRLDALRWQMAEQGGQVHKLVLDTQLRYGVDGPLDVQHLQLDADSLSWGDATRQAALYGLRLSGRLQQPLTTPATLPILTAGLEASRLVFSDSAGAAEIDLATLKLSDVSLVAGPAPAARRLAGKLAAGSGRLHQAESDVAWGGAAAGLGGILTADGVALQTDVELNGLSLAHPALAHGPLRIERLAADGLGLAEQSAFRRLLARGVELPGKPETTKLHVGAVSLADGSYSATAGANIGEIVIDGLQTGVVRDKAGVWRHVMSPPGKATQAASATPTEPVVSGAEPDWRIGALRVTGDSHITVVDTLNPDIQPIRYAVERIEVGALSSAAPNRDTPFDVALRPDQYSEFSIAGEVRPLASPLYLNARGHLHGFGLPSVNGLVANDLGHRFLDGQLDDDFTIKIEQQQLDMHNALGIAAVAVEEIPGKEGPPLTTAIALLEDRDGNIKLEVPVAGNLADPQFRVLGALNPIIMKAVAGTAALAIQPLGSVLLVGGLLANQALKVTFEPALFAPGSNELDAAAQSYLAQLAGKLVEKPKLGVRLCGVVVDAERKKDKNGAYLDQEADLLPLAQQRADAVRTFMAQEGAGKGQLRACRPALDPNPDSKPRVEIRF